MVCPKILQATLSPPATYATYVENLPRDGWGFQSTIFKYFVEYESIGTKITYFSIEKKLSMS